MGYLRILLLTIIYGFVVVGDFVSRTLSVVVSFFTRLSDISKYKSHVSRKSLSKKKVLYHSRNISLPRVSFRKPVLSLKKGVFKVLSLLLREVFMFCQFVIAVLKGIFLGVLLPFAFLVRFLKDRAKHRRTYVKSKVFEAKPSVQVKQEISLSRVVVWRTKLLYFFIGGLFSFVFFFLPLLFFIFISDLPHPTQLANGAIPKTTKIYDRNGQLLYEIFVNQNRTPVPLSDVPEDLVEATIAIEDKHFYSHPGFDVQGIGRALYENTTSDALQGGSTITQQLIKSALLTPEPTISRKVKEVVLAFWAERIYSKEQILEMYFNFVPYGGTAWGVSAASETYFGKNVQDLTLSESAFLAGLPRAPSVYSPFVGNGNEWRTRQKMVLNAMVSEGYISQGEANVAYSEKLTFRTNRTPLLAPHFVMYVKDQLTEKYGIGAVERGGLQVKTSLDFELQQKVQQLVTEEVDRSGHLSISNGAALVTDPSNGDILAMVGSRDYFDTERDGNVNVTQMKRQPGSTVKLVTYALALESGYSEATVLNDSPLTIEQAGAPSYRPVNYDGRFHGRVPLRLALANSYNIPAVRIAQDLGADSIVDLGMRMGITSWNNLQNYGLSITLGGSEVTMIDLATVYGTVANEGEKIQINPITEVRDSTGRVVESRESLGTRVLSSATAFILSDILADNSARSMAFGSSSPLYVPGKTVSVKTGTTDEKRDNWTVGFTPNRLVAVWVGNNDNTPMSPTLTSGISGAAPIWNKIMTDILSTSATQSAASVPEDVVVKECFGRKIYLARGTENSVRCGEVRRETLRRQ